MALALKLRRMRKKPPAGWEELEPTLEELEVKMREAETDPHEGKRKTEALWPIFRVSCFLIASISRTPLSCFKIHHQRARFVYDMFYKEEKISRELYQFCIDAKLIDAQLIAKWKKQGFENLCCLRCVQTRDTNFGTNCICRVPKSKLEAVRFFNRFKACFSVLKRWLLLVPILKFICFSFRIESSSAYIADAAAALDDIFLF